VNRFELWSVVALLVSSSAWAQAPPSAPQSLLGPVSPDPVIVEDHEPHTDCCLTKGCRHEDDPPDLTLWNFFTLGWNDEFTRRSSEDRAPDLALLRVQTNFMEREVRLNYFYESKVNSKTTSAINNFDYFIAYAFNRRFMVEVLGNEQWINGRGKSNDIRGEAPRFVGRVQLISTPDTSITYNFQYITPAAGLGQHQTTISNGFAGFEDLTCTLGLYRVGLYYSALFDSFVGPGTVGMRHSDVQYDVSIAKTFTRPDTPLIGNFTLFVETFAQTDLDGSNAGHTLASITPAVRFNLGKLQNNNIGIDNWLMGGVDLPICGPRPWNAIYRVTYIKNF
jgi:hypothetical protein